MSTPVGADLVAGPVYDSVGANGTFRPAGGEQR
jgi:hypothetical protein